MEFVHLLHPFVAPFLKTCSCQHLQPYGIAIRQLITLPLGLRDDFFYRSKRRSRFDGIVVCTSNCATTRKDLYTKSPTCTCISLDCLSFYPSSLPNLVSSGCRVVSTKRPGISSRVQAIISCLKGRRRCTTQISVWQSSPLLAANTSRTVKDARWVVFQFDL